MTVRDQAPHDRPRLRGTVRRRCPHVFGDAAELLERFAADDLRGLGQPVVDHRTSFVRRVDGRMVKVYAFETFGQRLRALPRSLPGRSRAVREFDALEWLAARGLQDRVAGAAFEYRAAEGLVRRAVLVTAAWPGTGLDRLLTTVDDEGTRHAALAAVARFVDRLEAVGFVDPNLDPRNLLVDVASVDLASGDTPRVLKIDSPRFKVVPTPGDPASRRPAPMRAARARLIEGLTACGVRAAERVTAGLG